MQTSATALTVGSQPVTCNVDIAFITFFAGIGRNLCSRAQIAVTRIFADAQRVSNKFTFGSKKR